MLGSRLAKWTMNEDAGNAGCCFLIGFVKMEFSSLLDLPIGEAHLQTHDVRLGTFLVGSISNWWISVHFFGRIP